MTLHKATDIDFRQAGRLCSSNQTLLIYPLHGRNTKKPKTKTAYFFVNTRILVKLLQKKPK